MKNRTMKTSYPIYLDYNATTPVDREVASAMQPFLTEIFGNPSSMHSYGLETKKAVVKAREQVAALLNCSPEEIIFTSGGSESNNMAIKGAVMASRGKGSTIITSSVEHPAVIEVCKYLEGQGYRVIYLPVDEYGLVDPDDLEKSISEETVLVSIMHANNEVGTIQPVKQLAEICRKHRVLFHSDAAQSVGKIKTDVREMGVDLLSVAGHKLYAPKGIGALYIRKGVKLEKLIHGADHEQNLRAGTENVLEIVGLGKACEIAARDLIRNAGTMKRLRDMLFDGLDEAEIDFHRNGHPEYCLPNTLSIGFRNIEANTLLLQMDKIAASAGAACHTGDEDVSGVLKAMNVADDYSMGTIRFSLGKYTTEEEVKEAIDIITKTVSKFSKSDGSVEEVRQEDIKLTHFTHGLGCACKLRPQELEKLLKGQPVPVNPDILVGPESYDDAAVYRINEKQALVLTVDYFTPIVDDPYAFGAIAAANALSDVYAMGAKPLFALNIVSFPVKRLPLSFMQKIMDGASDKASEAGIFILGGHTIEDTEPKFGMVVAGIVDINRVWRNNTARPGDMIILTKPVGTGIISTALKRGIVEKKLADIAAGSMAELNDRAADIAKKFTVHACTDVTGYGLLGHMKEMIEGSRVEAQLEASRVPVFEGVSPLVAANIIPGGTRNNLDYIADFVEWSDSISESDKYILADAQTSGGLLFAVPSNEAQKMLRELRKAGLKSSSVIGQIVSEGQGKVFVF